MLQDQRLGQVLLARNPEQTVVLSAFGRTPEAAVRVKVRSSVVRRELESQSGEAQIKFLL